MEWGVGVMAKYVGFCSEAVSGPTQWGDGDVIGTLLVQEPDGWYAAGRHYSSSVGYAQGDVKRLFDRVFVEGDSYEWVGQFSGSQAFDRYPAGTAMAAAE